ncbi:MAG: glycosyltransferase, partial [Vicinamibacterales bacterium]
MAMGLPVVATDTPTNAAILGGLGYLCPPNSPLEFADAIERAFDDSPDARAALRQRVIDNYAWRNRILDIEHVYRRVIARQRPGLLPAPEPAAASD